VLSTFLTLATPRFSPDRISVTHLGMSSGPKKPRGACRLDIAAEVGVRRAGAHSYRVRVFDASPEGCKIEFVERPAIGEHISSHLRARSAGWMATSAESNSTARYMRLFLSGSRQCQSTNPSVRFPPKVAATASDPLQTLTIGLTAKPKPPMRGSSIW
jgi:hypothetical protein